MIQNVFLAIGQIQIINGSTNLRTGLLKVMAIPDAYILYILCMLYILYILYTVYTVHTVLYILYCIYYSSVYIVYKYTVFFLGKKRGGGLPDFSSSCSLFPVQRATSRVDHRIEYYLRKI